MMRAVSVNVRPSASMSSNAEVRAPSCVLWRALPLPPARQHERDPAQDRHRRQHQPPAQRLGKKQHRSERGHQGYRQLHRRRPHRRQAAQRRVPERIPDAGGHRTRHDREQDTGAVRSFPEQRDVAAVPAAPAAVPPDAPAGRTGSPAWTPLDWPDLESTDVPVDLNYSTFPGLLTTTGDPWAEINESARDLPALSKAGRSTRA